MSETRSARAQVASLSRWRPDDRAAIQAAKNRLLVANLRALLADAKEEDEDHD